MRMLPVLLVLLPLLLTATALHLGQTYKARRHMPDASNYCEGRYGAINAHASTRYAAYFTLTKRP